jgi:uroporphyrinogen III methyltransferase / synthase
MRILVTRPEKDAFEFAQALQKIGAEALYLPAIEIAPVADTGTLDQAFSRLHCYDWLVLTSANAAGVFLDRKAALGINGLPKNLGIAAIGSRTAARLQEQGVRPNFVPEDYITEAILPGLGDLRGKWVLIPAADIAHDTLPQAIREVDGIAHVIIAYHTLPAELDSHGLAALRDGLDWITFASGSAARNFVALVRGAGLDPFDLPGNPQVACIGPKTARAAQELGFQVTVVAETYTVEGLVQAIQSHTNKTGLR